MIGRVAYKLDIECCFCGSSLEIDEASRSLKCAHCASALRIARTGVPKFYIRNDLAKREVKFLVDRQLKHSGQSLVSSWCSLAKVYLPFWRVTGTVFSILDRTRVLGEQVYYEDFVPVGDVPSAFEVKIVPRDVSICADDGFRWGLETLGVRTQVIKLTPVENDFQRKRNLAPVRVSRQQAEQRFLKAAASVALLGPYHHKEVDLAAVDLETSLVYFPLWLASYSNRKGKHSAQLDPVAKRVVAITAGEFEASPAETDSPNVAATVTVVPHRCPNCGADLPEAERSVTFYCGNCRRLYLDDGGGYRRLEVAVPDNVNPEHRLFPFWVYDLKEAEYDGKEQLLDTLRLLQLNATNFYLPAFEITNPTRVLRLMSFYNSRRQDFTFQSKPSQNYRFADVVRTPRQAAELIAPLITAAAAKDGYRVPGGIRSRIADVEKVKLVWLPYALNRYFWCDQLTGATIERAAVNCS